MVKRSVCHLFVLLLAAPVAAQNDLLPDVQAERAKYPDGPIPADTIAKILNAVAWAHRAEGWGMLEKVSGNSCPIAGTFVSCDILIHKPSVTHWDVLNNAEGDGSGTAAAQFNLVGPCVPGPASGCAMSHFLDPLDPGDTVPTTAPEPGPPATAAPDFGPRVTMLEQQVQSLTGEIRSLRDQAAALTATVTATTAATDANTESVARIDKYLAEHPIAVSCRARLGGVPIGCSLQ
jgi:hypothetical protein